MRLEDKVAIITGSGGGQGKAAALLFSREGAKVVITDWNAELGEQALQEVKGAGGDAIFVQADVSKSADVRNLVDRTVDTYGRVDVLYNNAGVGYSSALSMNDILNTPEEDWDRVIEINLKSVFLTCKHALPHMIEAGRGSIICTASIAALVGMESAQAYTASKGGVVALARALAVQHAQNGIRVNSICPGGVDTDMVRPGTRSTIDGGGSLVPGADERARQQAAQWEQAMAAARTQRGVKRFGDPDDIAYLALYLASDESAFVTGANFVIDGGVTAQ